MIKTFLTAPSRAVRAIQQEESARGKLAASMDRRPGRATRVPINPKLPAKFDCTPNDARPDSHQRWWHRPFIQTFTFEQIGGNAEQRTRWFEHWPTGTRYDVRCLDGGAWDRPTCWGMFGTLEEAMSCATAGKEGA